MVRLFLGLRVVAAAAPVMAKPIAFAGGTTVMAEYGAGTMEELQIFYAPRYDYSLGGGHEDFTSDVDGHREHINYARLNWLPHRWNLDDAQANVFVWGGAGSATGNRFDGTRVTGNAGAQADYETRRIYMYRLFFCPLSLYSASSPAQLRWTAPRFQPQWRLRLPMPTAPPSRPDWTPCESPLS